MSGSSASRSCSAARASASRDGEGASRSLEPASPVAAATVMLPPAGGSEVAGGEMGLVSGWAAMAVVLCLRSLPRRDQARLRRSAPYSPLPTPIRREAEPSRERAPLSSPSPHVGEGSGVRAGYVAVGNACSHRHVRVAFGRLSGALTGGAGARPEAPG